MSDNWIRLIPADPRFVPEPSRARAVVEVVTGWMTAAVEIRILSDGDVVFVDSGANFESVSCCTCAQQLDLGWWSEQMTKAHETGFRDLATTCPMCQVDVSLNDLCYDWPQGFASWCLDILNPGISHLTTDQIDKIAQGLGHPVRVIYRHL